MKRSDREQGLVEGTDFVNLRHVLQIKVGPAFILTTCVARLLSIGGEAVAQEVLDCGRTIFHVQDDGPKKRLTVPGFMSFGLTTESKCELQKECQFSIKIGGSEKSWRQVFETEIDGLCSSTRTVSKTHANSHFKERGDYRFGFKEVSVTTTKIPMALGMINLTEIRYYNLPDDYMWSLFHGDDVNGATIKQDIVRRTISITDEKPKD